MIYIDIYVLTDKIEFSIFRHFLNNKKIIKKNEIVLPTCYTTPQKLSYIRNLIDIFIEEYGIKHFKIKIGDVDNSREINDILGYMEGAIKIEGVLEELFTSRGVEVWI